LNIVYQPYKETDGTIIGVMVLCQDVTEQVVDRKKAEEAEETATLAITSAELGTFHVYLRTNQIKSSKRLDEIFDVADLTERSRYIEAIHPDDLLIRAKAYEIARKTGLLEYEGRVIRKNGIIRWFRVKGRMSFDDHHQPLEIVGVVMDITEEKLFSEELSRQVKERTQELEQFTYVSHHDLQEPLRKIVMYTEMVRSESYGALSETSKSRLDKVTKAARRMSTALKDVLNFASLSKQEFLTNVNLDEILAAVQTDLELLILEKSAKIQSQELPTIKAIPQQMQQLFYNLLSNGLKFTRKDQQPVITISGRMLNDAEIKDHPDLSPAKQYYQLDVRDNGIGFQNI
jgi:PAS domain S-box-containing protein